MFDHFGAIIFTTNQSKIPWGGNKVIMRKAICTVIHICNVNLRTYN
jgi:hypothetical protein